MSRYLVYAQALDNIEEVIDDDSLNDEERCKQIEDILANLREGLG